VFYGAFAGDRVARPVSWLAVLVLIVAGLVLVPLAGKSTTAFHGQFIIDSYAVFAKILVLIGSALTIIISLSYNERENMARFEYPVLILLTSA
jgi:NADH-quinone oxidoreductase subunit N